MTSPNLLISTLHTTISVHRSPSDPPSILSDTRTGTKYLFITTARHNHRPAHHRRLSSVGMLPNHSRHHRSAQNSTSQGLQRQPTAFVGPDSVAPLPPTQQNPLMAPPVDTAVLQGRNPSSHSSGSSCHHHGTPSQSPSRRPTSISGSQGLQHQPSEILHLRSAATAPVILHPGCDASQPTSTSRSQGLQHQPSEMLHPDHNPGCTSLRQVINGSYDSHHPPFLVDTGANQTILSRHSITSRAPESIQSFNSYDSQDYASTSQPQLQTDSATSTVDADAEDSS